MTPGRWRAVLWSSAHAAVLGALVDEHGALPVVLGTQADNPADAQAVAIATDLPALVVGGVVAYYDNNGEAVRIIGYVSRACPDKAALHAQLAQATAAWPARLVREAAEWYVEIPARPESDDEDPIPF